MEAGREMDCLIAQYIYGWGIDTSESVHRNHGYYQGKKLSQYSADIAAAWEIFTHFVGMSIGQRNGTYECYIDGFPNSLTFADSAPLAICRAALKAMGVNEV